jgi:hypothetical protein
MTKKTKKMRFDEFDWNPIKERVGSPFPIKRTKADIDWDAAYASIRKHFPSPQAEAQLRIQEKAKKNEASRSQD